MNKENSKKMFKDSACALTNAHPNKKRILVVDPGVCGFGGGWVVGLWMLEALKADYDVSFFCWSLPSLEAINRFAGTKLQAGDFTLISPPAWMRIIGEAAKKIDPDPGSNQRWALMQRYLHQIGSQFDLIVSNGDETALPTKGMQYIHYPYLAEKHLLPITSGDEPLYRQASSKWRPWRLISGYSPSKIAANHTFTNSGWTASQFAQRYGVTPDVLYPPVPISQTDFDWDCRSNIAVAIGRLSIDKEYPEIIDIIKKVREKIPDLRLRIIGLPSDAQHDRDVLPFLKNAASEFPWLTLHLDLDRDEMEQLVRECRFGIHAKRDEHFGIAVAELIRSGCITLTHNSGGQTEIIDEQSALLFDDPSQAAANICAIHNEADLRNAVIAALQRKQEEYSSARFCADFLRAVDKVLANQKDAA